MRRWTQARLDEAKERCAAIQQRPWNLEVLDGSLRVVDSDGDAILPLGDCWPEAVVLIGEYITAARADLPDALLGIEQLRQAAIQQQMIIRQLSGQLQQTRQELAAAQRELAVANRVVGAARALWNAPEHDSLWEFSALIDSIEAYDSELVLMESGKL